MMIMRIHRLKSITRAASLLLGGLALTACDPKILLGEFGDTQGEEESGGGGTEGQSSGNSSQGQSSGGTEGQSSGGSSSESQSGGETGNETGNETGDETGTTGTTGETGTTGTTGGAEDECDVWAQDCPAGQKCAPYDGGNPGGTWNSLRCVDLDPMPKSVGQSCHIVAPWNGEDDCELGAMCWETDPVTNEGTCRALCEGSPQSPTCDSGTHCLLSNDALNICLPDCNPLLQDCEAGQACIPLLDPASDQFICVIDSGGAEGQALDPCEFANACDPGLWCTDPALASECDPMFPGCCIPFCDLDEANTCPGVDQECLPWYEPMQAPPGREDVGFCGLAP
jgi:hypothetical protein